MTRKNLICIDCNSAAITHSITRQGRYRTLTQITFSCGARQEEVFDRENSIGRIEFEGCTCAP